MFKQTLLPKTLPLIALLAGSSLTGLEPAVATEQNNQKLRQPWLASDGKAGDLFGFSVSLHKSTAVVGAHQADTDQGSDAGAVYVFTRHNGCWSEEARLTASDGTAGDMFGGMTAIEDNTLVVGVIRHDHPERGADTGAAYVFQRIDGTWQEQVKLTAHDAAAGDGLGWSVGVASQTVVIGAPKADDKGTDAGAVYVFDLIGDQWQQTAKLTAGDATAGDLFGISLAISGDTLLIGADLHDTTAQDAGAAYVFTRENGNWSQQAKLTASDGQSEDIFGVRVALEDDLALISARRDDVAGIGTDAGSTYVFVREGTQWQQQAKLIAPDGHADDRFGRSVAIANNKLIIGAMLHDAAADDAGAAYVFSESENGWKMVQKLTAPDGGAQDRFGWAVAADGTQALIAATGHDDQGENAGAAYLINDRSFAANCGQ
jgi:hypothetical protein